MNNGITSHSSGGSEKTDATSTTEITDFAQVVSSTVGRDRQEQRRQKIREELVRERFGVESDESQASSSIRHRILKLLKFN